MRPGKKFILILSVSLGIFAALLSGCATGGKVRIEGEQPVEAWELNDGGIGSNLASVVDGTRARHQWGVWLNNYTFGRSLDFSIAGSYAAAIGTRASLINDFTVSLWLMAPPRGGDDRVILTVGQHEIRLDAANNFELFYSAADISGLESSGVSLTDGKWHHVVISRAADVLTYYIDGASVKSVTISGRSETGSGDVVIGAAFDGEKGDYGFDGTIAEVRIYDKALLPSQATRTTLDPRDNEPQAPRLNMKRGLTYDRRQYIQPEPLPTEGQTVREEDIINAKNMGFDHVKLLLTPNHLIAGDGSLIEANMFYIARVVKYVTDNGYKCIVCLHPERDFKPHYLGNLNNFEILAKWYGEYAKWVGRHWSPDEVALQLMTEPGANYGSWTWMSDRMWGAVRNVLPDHTIITSSDQYGNIERLKVMSPASDSNLVYSFTTYEPYTIGWYWYSTNPNRKTFWGYVKDIPYPVEEGVDYTAAIENAIELVPDAQKVTARAAIKNYIQGKNDGDSTVFRNSYDSLYNAEWHRMRAKSLDDWRQKNGGNIHIMCVEFGCMDRFTPVSLWRTAVEGSGIPDKDRIQFVRDMRSAFDEYNIGWDYWSYNEAHTVFLPEKHRYGVSPLPGEAVGMFDWDMLEYGLGVTPLVPKP
jgi:hypothetical protein